MSENPYCIHEDEPGQDCGQPAVAERLNGLSGDGTAVVERVCYDHAQSESEQR